MAEDRRTARPPASPPDPFAMWREWMMQSEHQLNKVFNDMMGTEEFARASGSWIEAMTMFQQTMNESAQRYFEMAGVPTRSDVGEVAERLAAVEERLQRIETLLTTALGRREVADQAVRPARTRRPPSERRAAEQARPQAAAPSVDTVTPGTDAASGKTGPETK